MRFTRHRPLPAFVFLCSNPFSDSLTITFFTILCKVTANINKMTRVQGFGVLFDMKIYILNRDLGKTGIEVKINKMRCVVH